MALFVYPSEGLYSKVKGDMDSAIQNLNAAKSNASFSTVDSINLSGVSGEIQSVISDLDTISDEFVDQDKLVSETFADISSNMSWLGNIQIKDREKYIL